MYHFPRTEARHRSISYRHLLVVEIQERLDGSRTYWHAKLDHFASSAVCF